MGVHALGLLTPEEYERNTWEYMTKLKETLYDLGAFGDDSWSARITLYNINSKTNIRYFNFSDEPGKNVAMQGENIIIGDASLTSFLNDLNLINKGMALRIDGFVFQLGDFKIRFGEAVYKDTTYGLLFDIEFIPATRVLFDFTDTFNSLCELIGIRIPLFLPAPNPEMEYNYALLAVDYLKIYKHYKIPLV